MHKPHRDKRLTRYFNEQRGVCYICRDDMTLDLGKPNTATIEHVQPKAKGGAKKPFNEAAACSECNRLKSDRNPAEFLRWFVGYQAKLQAEEVNDNVVQLRLVWDEPDVA